MFEDYFRTSEEAGSLYLRHASLKGMLVLQRVKGCQRLQRP